MVIDFSRIENERIGYKLKADSIGGQNRLEHLTFGEFIPPYLSETRTAQQVYDSLNETLKYERRNQDSITDRKRSVFLEVLSIATLQREAIMNAMRLIENNYIQKK